MKDRNQEHEVSIRHFPRGSQNDRLKKRQSPTRPRTKPEMSERKVRTYRWLSTKYKHSSPVLVQEFSISEPGSPTRLGYQVTGRVSGRQKQVHSRCRPESNVSTVGPKAEAFSFAREKGDPGQQCRVEECLLTLVVLVDGGVPYYDSGINRL